MLCDLCRQAATYICRCSGLRLCKTCVGVHLLEEGMEHQLAGIEEGEESYTEAEMRTNPAILTKRLDQELVRLEAFRRGILHLADSELEKYTRNIRLTARKRLETYKPEFDKQREGLEAALKQLNTTDMLTALPNQGYPWDICTQEAAIRVPDGLEMPQFCLEDTLEVSIQWDLAEYTKEIRQKRPERLVLHTPADISSEKSGGNTPVKTDFSGLDPEEVYETLKNDPQRRLIYLEERKTQEKLRKLLETGISEDNTKLKVAFWTREDPWTDLSLHLLSCQGLKTLKIHRSSISLRNFTQLTDTIQQIRVENLILSRCKLSTKHVQRLIQALPPAVKALDLSENYFDVKVVRGVPFLRKLTVKEVPIPAGWVELMETSEPQLVLTLTSSNSS